MPGIVEARLRRIFHELDEAALGAPEDESLTEDDVDLSTSERDNRIFGVYTRKGLITALRSYGAFSRLEKRLGGEVELKLELEDPFRPRILIWSVKHDAAAVDIRLSICAGSDVGLTGGARHCRLVYLEDIVIEHPGAPFDWSRPPLPDQRHPGLGVARDALGLLLLLTRRVGAEGLALRPTNFHVARLYSRVFLFVDPIQQGRLEAILREGRWIPNWLLAWSVATGCVTHSRGKPLQFQPSPMICPMGETVTNWFTRETWKRARVKALQTVFQIDLQTTVERIPWERFPQFPPPAPIARLLADMLPLAFSKGHV